MNTYTKLRNGSWGVRAQGKVLAGAQLDVTTKAGAVKSETVSTVLWVGKDRQTGETISLCAVGVRNGNGHVRSGHAGEVRCRHCHQWTMEGDDWCMACGRADYE